MERHHGTLREPDQGQAGIVEAVPRQLRVDEGVDQRRGAGDAGQHAAGPAVLQAEPLAAVGGEVAGLRAVRGHEPGVRQVAGQHRGQPDQVLAVRAHAVQQDDELARRAAGTRAEAGPLQLCHVGSRLW